MKEENQTQRSRWYGCPTVWVVAQGEPREGYSISEVYGDYRSAYAHCRKVVKHDKYACWKKTAKSYWVNAAGEYMEIREYLIK